MSKPRRSRIRLLAAERSELERRVAARTASQQDAYRAQIILRVAAGQTDAAIARDMGLAERTVWLWRHRFAEHRLDGLKDRPKCPPPRQYHADIQARVLVLACQKPAEVDPTRVGQTHWSIKDLAQYVAAHPELGLGSPSKSTIGVILKRHQVRLDRLDTWMNDRDPEFATKAVAIIELLLSPPTDGPLFCVDEKPGIGVRRPTAPDQPPAPRRLARREFEYVRNGTVDLLAGFRVNDGQVYGMVRLKHRSREFCELLALLDEQTPTGMPIHLILDPVSSHWSAEVASWLDSHPHRRFVFHFLPVHASWLSFIEVWFSIISRKCLKRADFADATVATQQIEGFIATYNTHSAHPFEWKKGVRFYKRLKAKIAARQELQLAA
jgi:transposase